MAFRALLFAALLLLLPAGCSKQVPDGAKEGVVPVRVGLGAVDNRNLPVVVLEEEDGPRWLPIWIGTAEARSIALEIEQQKLPRPNTHDLAKRVIQHLDSEVVRVVVTELKSGTYYAILVLRRGSELVEIDSRPSDAIAIAIRVNAPIFVHAPLFDGVDREVLTREDGEQI